MTALAASPGSSTVGWIGLGAMGYPMAARTVADFDTLVWNRTESVARQHAAEHGSIAVPLAQAAGADVVLSCLSNTAAVAEVISLARPALRPGTVWVDCTSGEPAGSRALAERLAGFGVEYLDAPVSGMVAGAKAGTLSMLVGGDPAALTRVRPVLAMVSDKIVHMGAVGNGHLTKAANNSLFAITFWAAAEVLAGIVTAGVSVPTALEAINSSSGRSDVTQRFLRDCVLAVDPAPGYRLGQSGIDIGLLAGALAADGLAPCLLTAVGGWYDELTACTGAAAGAAQAFVAIGQLSRCGDGHYDVASTGLP